MMIRSSWDSEVGRVHTVVPDDVALRPSGVTLQPGRRRPGVLYRYFDTQGVLLYVGITTDASAREGIHRTASGWRIFADTITRARFDDIRDAERTERWVIPRERPIFNKDHNRTFEAQDRLVAYLTQAGRLDLLPQLSILRLGVPDGKGRVQVRRVVVK